MENKLVKIAAAGFVGLVVVPTLIGGGLKLIAIGASGIEYLVNLRKIKKGLKDGSVIEVDGKYYEVPKDVIDAEIEEA